ncbi:MAG: hypothetical protein ABJZ55_17840 [Fuerstiella sp.]
MKDRSQLDLDILRRSRVLQIFMSSGKKAYGKKGACGYLACMFLMLWIPPALAQELIIPSDDGRLNVPQQSTIPPRVIMPGTTQPRIRIFNADPSIDAGVDRFDGNFENTFDQDERTEFGIPAVGNQGFEDLSITIATPLLARFVNDEQVKSKPVVTQVMEASVSGTQTTTTKVMLKSVDSISRAELQIQTEGTVSSTTVGVTRQATINTLGSHTFQVTKPVYFDGRQFLTKQAYGSLQARQFPQAVNTNVGRSFPLLGRLGNQIAWNQVQRRMPMSDAIVVRKVADDVLPSVNTSVDAELIKLNRRWSEFNQKLSRISLLPTLNWSTASTSNSMTIAVSNPEIHSRIMRSSSLTDALREEEVCSVLLDELAVNHWLDRQNLQGLQVSDADIRQLVQQLPELMKQPARLIELFRSDSQSGRPALLFSVKLAAEQPLRMQFRDGKLFFTARFQLLPKLGQPSIFQEVRIGLQGEPAEGDRWAIAMKDANVRPLDDGVEPDTWTTVIQAQLDTLLQNQQPSGMSRVLKASVWDNRFPDLKLDRVQAVDGFLRVAFTLANRSLSL